MPAGRHCRMTLTAAGGELLPLGAWSFHEDVVNGSALQCRVRTADAPDLQPGGLLDLELEEQTPQGVELSAARLWIRKVARQRDRARDEVWIEANDPLAHARAAAQFRSHAGKVALDVVTRHILAMHAPHLERAPALADGFPSLPQPWLLQAGEDGRGYLDRLARSLDHALYWCREELHCDPCGRAPSHARTLEPDPDLELDTTSIARAIPHPGGQLRWTDPATRLVRQLQVGDGEICQRPAPAVVAPPARIDERDADHGTGEILTLTGGLFRARPGDTIDLGDAGRWSVSRCSHTMDGLGSYSTTLKAVRSERWGVSDTPGPDGLVGPFQAVVTHNHDEAGLGRVRVRLAEDPDARPTPFLPLVASAGGAGTGLFRLPEVGESVLVVTDRRCPESLHVLGPIRCKGDEIAQEWSRDDNGIKAFMTRSGVGIVLDDQAGTITLITPDSRLVLGTNGEIVIEGQTLRQDMRKETFIKSGKRTRLDAARIELG